MGKSVRDGLGDPFAFKPEYNGQIRTATKQSPEQTPAANDSFSFKPEYNDTVKKKVGVGESSLTESPSPESINNAYQNFQNKSLTPQDIKTLQTTQWGKENNITGIPEKAIPLFVEAHNGKTQDDLRTTMVNGIINQFYPPSQDLQQEAARKKITAQVLSGDQDAIQKVKGAVVQNIQKQIDDRENQINGGNSGDLGMARSAVAAFKDPVIKQLKEKINQVSGTIDQYGMNALVNSPDIKPFLDIDKNHPQLLTSVAASKVGKLIQEKYGLDNSSGNVEYERSKAGMAQIINNLSMEYNSTLKQAIISKNPELIKKAQEQAQNLSRYSSWYNKLDSEQFTDVGQQNTARFLGDVIAKKHPGKWIVTKSDVDEAAQQANTENPGWLDKYGKFLGPLKEHPMAVPAPGFGGALERGAVGAVYNLANLADYVLPKSVEHGAERQEDQSSAFFKGTSYSGQAPTKVVYDKNNKAYRELSNEHYGSIDWNNAFRFMGESVPGLMQWIAPEMAGADVAKGLGASEKAQRLIGLTTAAYLTGYDNNRKTADELITDTGTSGEAKKAVLANLLTFSTIATFKALDYSPTKFVEQAIAKSAAPDALKILEGTNWDKLSQEQTESFLKDQVLPRAKAVVSKIGENALQGAKVGVATVADQKIKDLLSTNANPDKAKTSSLEDNMKTLVEQSLLMSVIGLPGVVKSGFQSPSMKDALYEAGNYAPQYIERVNNMLDAGQIDQAKANQMISIIKTIGEEVAKSKDVETEDELPITNQQRKEIVLANFRDRAAAKMKEDGATDVDHVNGEVKKQVKEIRSQNFYEDLQPQLDAIQKDRDAELKMSPEDQHNSINAKYDAEIVNLEQGKDYVSRGNIIENNNITKGLLRRGLENDNIDQEYAPFVDHPEHVFDYISKEIQDGKEAEMTKEFGKELVNRAQEKAQNDNYTEHVAPILKRINDADYINEKELDKSANVLYDVLDRVDKNEDLTPEQKQSIGNLIEPLITKIEGYDFRTKIETSHVTERIPTIVPTEVGRKKEIVPALEQSKGEPATVTLPSGETRKGTLNIKGGQYVIDVPGSEQLVIGEKAITDRDLKLPDENKIENPVGFDENGNVKSVTFETKNGNLVTIENPEKALDLAIQLRADAIGEVPKPEFDLIYKEVQKQISQERLVKEPAATAEPSNNSQPKTETNGNQESSQKNGPEEGGQSSQEGNPGESQGGQNDVLKNEGGEQPKGEAPPLTEPSEGSITPVAGATEDGKGGITHAANEERRLDMRMKEYEKTAQTFAEWDEAADKLLKEGYNVDNLISEIERTNRPTNEIENAILKKYIATLDAEINSNPTPENIYRRKRFVLMKDLSNSAAGRALVSLKGQSGPGTSLADFLQDKMEANGVNTLTETQIKEQQAKYDELKKANDQYKEEIDKLQADNKRLSAEKEVKKQQSKSGGKNKKVHEDYVKERKDIVQQMRADLLKIAKGSEGAMLNIPGAAQLKAMAPHVAKLVKSLVEEGVTKLDDIISRIHDDVKELGVSKNDLRDIIAGDYNEKQLTRSQLAEQLRNIKREAELLNELERARRGEDSKTEKKKFEKDRRIIDLENKIKEVRRLNKQIKDEDEGVQEKGNTKGEKTYEEKLADRQNLLKKQIADIQDKIAKKIYADEPTNEPPLKLDKKTQALQDQLIELKRKRALELARDQYEKQNIFSKGLDKAWQVLGLKRVIQTAVDFSMPFRQAIVTTLNPFKFKTTGEAFKNMFVHTFRPKEFKRFMFQLEESGLKQAMEQDKLTLSEPDELQMDKRDEEFRTSILDRIRNSKSPLAKQVQWLLEPIFASERAAASYINTIRINEYVKKTKALEKAGITRENNPQAYQDMAKWILNSTGRGNMLKFIEDSKAGREIAGNTFYGARLMASRFNMLNPLYYKKMPPEIRVEAMKDMAGFVSGIMLSGIALSAAGGKIETDWDQPDFMQIRFGDKVYDLTGGMVQYVRTFLRIASLAKKTGTTNRSDEDEMKDLGKYNRKTNYSTTKFFTNKLAPNTAYAYHFLTGKGGDGKDFRPTEIFDYYPMYVDDLKKGMQEDGASSLLTILLPSLFGVGVQQYEKQ